MHQLICKRLRQLKFLKLTSLAFRASKWRLTVTLLIEANASILAIRLASLLLGHQKCRLNARLSGCRFHLLHLRPSRLQLGQQLLLSFLLLGCGLHLHELLDADRIGLTEVGASQSRKI